MTAGSGARKRSPEARARRAAKRAEARTAAAMEGVAEAALLEARAEERPDLCRRCFQRPHVPLHELCRACRYYTRNQA